VPRLSHTIAAGEQRPPLGELWKDTTITMPRASSEFLNVFTGEVLSTSASRTLLCSDLFSHFPAALLLGL
jgi:maltooligosyltrehalose synthase